MRALGMRWEPGIDYRGGTSRIAYHALLLSGGSNPVHHASAGNDDESDSLLLTADGVQYE